MRCPAIPPFGRLVVLCLGTLGPTAVPGSAVDAQVPQTDSLSMSPVGSLYPNLLEHSYVAPSSGFGTLDSLVLEANIAPNLSFAFRSEKWWVPDVLTLTPKINLRIFRQESSPVRAPSFMPQVAVRWWANDLGPSDSTATIISMRVSHHSNGQDGDFNLPDGSVNYEDGSFSTNFVVLGVTAMARSTLPDTLTSFIGLALEVHPGVNMDRALRRNYGRLRVKSRSRLSGRALRESWQWLTTSTEVAWRMWGFTDEGFFSKRRWSFRINWVFSHETVEDLGLWVDYYWGPDYYNISFARHMSSFRAGVKFDFGGVAAPHRNN